MADKEKWGGPLWVTTRASTQGSFVGCLREIRQQKPWKGARSERFFRSDQGSGQTMQPTNNRFPLRRFSGFHQHQGQRENAHASLQGSTWPPKKNRARLFLSLSLSLSLKWPLSTCQACVSPEPDLCRPQPEQPIGGRDLHLDFPSKASPDGPEF